MLRINKIAGLGLSAALAVLPLTLLAHGVAGEEAAEFDQHMDEYPAEIEGLIATVDDIVAGYAPDKDYTEELKALTEQWESVDIHLAIEVNAPRLYPPVWVALGQFSNALKKGAPTETVAAAGDGIGAALWQGYGALKLLAAREAQGQNLTQAAPPVQAGGAGVIDQINNNLDQVLTLYKQGKSQAAQELIFDTYMQRFEGIEGDLIEQNAQLVSDLEADFNATLPLLIKNEAPAEKVSAQIEAMQVDLETARELLAAAEEQESSVF